MRWLFKQVIRLIWGLLVANGRSQQFGVDCDDTFSRVVKLATIRAVLSLALSRNWPIHQLDVKNAFLNGDLSETVYMYQPPGFLDARFPHHVCRLQRSLYGLKQAPRAWFQRFASYVNGVGFSSSHCDSSLIIYQHGYEVAYLLIYVDDIVLTTSSTNLLQRIISSLHKEFDMTDLGGLNYFLGISVTRDSTSMFLSQKKYALKLLDKAHMANFNPTRTPVDTESKLGSDGDPISDPTLYHSLAGGLQSWLSTVARYSVIIYFQLLSFLSERASYTIVSITLVYCDNVSAIYMTDNPVQHQHTKHIEIDIHFVRDMVARGQVRVLHVPSRYQYADIFTKGLPSALFEEFLTSLSCKTMMRGLVVAMVVGGGIGVWVGLVVVTIVGGDGGLVVCGVDGG
ncbi:ribonuclease H-like domain-containing protein [Tanacetum coccineum]